MNTEESDGSEAVSTEMKRPRPYKEAFPAGAEVRVADREFLDDFVATWKYHHKLQSEQPVYADRVTKGEGVSFYHGGDPLGKLLGLPRPWHEQCLRPS